MKVVGKTPSKTAIYDETKVGDVFKFEGTICIAINNEDMLRYDSKKDVWNVVDAPYGDDTITLLDCELVIKGEK